MDEANGIAAMIESRQDRFEESLRSSIMVVLLNAGDRFVAVRCVGPEQWTGTKAELTPRDGVPLCPSGHPMLETDRGRRLGWVQGI
jgi:hypothetical protein